MMLVYKETPIKTIVDFKYYYNIQFIISIFMSNYYLLTS
jgi:hypothetical protein